MASLHNSSLHLLVIDLMARMPRISAYTSTTFLVRARAPLSLSSSYVSMREYERAHEPVKLAEWSEFELVQVVYLDRIAEIRKMKSLLPADELLAEMKLHHSPLENSCTSKATVRKTRPVRVLRSTAHAT